MKVIKNYLYNAGYQLLTVLLPLITTPYVTRTLTESGYGIYSFTYANIQYFVLLAGLGINIYGNREIAYCVGKEDYEKLSNTFWEIQLLKTVSVLFAFLVFSFTFFWNIRYKTIVLIQSINILTVLFDISWLYMGLENFKVTVLRNTVVKLLSLILIFTLVKDSNDLWIYTLIMAGSLLGGNLTLWPNLKKIVSLPRFNELHPFRHFRPSLVLFLPQVALQLYMQLNKTMLGIMVSTTASGFYYSADLIIKVILSIVTATGTVMLPHASQAYSRGDIKSVKKMLYTSFDFVSFLAIPMAFGIAAISHGMAPWFLGKDFAPVGTLIMIESIVIVFSGWGNVIGEQYLLPMRENKEYTFSIIIGAVTNIVINIPLITFLKSTGAMISYCISELAVITYQIFIVRNELALSKLFVNLYKYLFSGAIMFIAVYYLNLKLNTNILTLSFQIMLGILIYIILIVITKPSILFKIKNIRRTK